MWFIRLGSKIWGPVSEAELQTLHRRGEFTNIHQISPDQAKWTPATDLIQSWKNPGAKIVDVPTLQVSQEAWYYCLPNRQQVGPISRDEITEKARTGQILPKTLIYAPDQNRWVAAFEVGFLGFSPPRKNSTMELMLFALLAIMVCVITGVGTYFAIRYFQSDSPVVVPNEPQDNSKP